jgi:hypothetical protein
VASAPPPPDDHGGFEGRYADLFDRAFAVCYDLSYRAVTADPPATGPRVYSAKRSIPHAAIGSTDRDDEHAIYALQIGCHAGQTAAFAAADFRPPPEWDHGEFPEPPADEPDRSPREEPAGRPVPFRGVLVSKPGLQIEIGSVVDHSDRISFEVTITPAGEGSLRPEYQDPLPWPPRVHHPDAFTLSVRLQDGAIVVGTVGAKPHGPEGHMLALCSASAGPHGAQLEYWLAGALSPHGNVTISCSWPTARVSGTITVPAAALLAA